MRPLQLFEGLELEEREQLLMISSHSTIAGGSQMCPETTIKLWLAPTNTQRAMVRWELLTG